MAALPASGSRVNGRSKRRPQVDKPTAQFVLEDTVHCESIGTFNTLHEAQAELRRLATIAWDQPPNRAPCGSWQTCGRNYEIREFDVAQESWRMVSRIAGFEISAAGVVWKISDESA